MLCFNSRQIDPQCMLPFKCLLQHIQDVDNTNLLLKFLINFWRVFPCMHMFCYRYIHSLGLLYWCPWTTKECGIWGLQFGKGSILGNNFISRFGMRSTALLMSTTFLLIFLFVAKLLVITLNMIHRLFNTWSVMLVWLQEGAERLKGEKSVRILYLYILEMFKWSISIDMYGVSLKCFLLNFSKVL